MPTVRRRGQPWPWELGAQEAWRQAQQAIPQYAARDVTATQQMMEAMRMQQELLYQQWVASTGDRMGAAREPIPHPDNIICPACGHKHCYINVNRFEREGQHHNFRHSCGFRKGAKYSANRGKMTDEGEECGCNYWSHSSR